MITDTLDDCFRSARLIYRAGEVTDKGKKFIHEQILSDPINVALSGPERVSPPTNKGTDWTVDKLSKATLGVMICLPPVPAAAETEDKRETNGEPTPIGFLALDFSGPPEPQVAHHRHTELGITIARSYQNQGYGAEAINWALDWAFRRAGMHRVGLGAVAYNLRGRHLYQKLGFVEEGRTRETHWHDRKWYDYITYGMLESEWMAIRGIKLE